MGMTLAELVLILGAVAGIYKLLAPVQRRVEEWMLDRFNPGRRRIIDVRSEKE